MQVVQKHAVPSHTYRIFPEPLKIGPKAIRWRADEIQKWVESRPRARGESNTSPSPVPARGSRGQQA